MMKEAFKSSSKCWICGNMFAEGDNKVRYHDHITGKYSGGVLSLGL